MSAKTNCPLRLESYGSLLRTLMPSAAGFGLFFLSGDSSWKGAVDDCSDVGERWKRLVRESNGESLKGFRGDAWQLASGNTAYVMPLFSGIRECMAALVTVLPLNGSGTTRPYTLVKGLMEPALTSIERELRARRAIAALRRNMQARAGEFSLISEVEREIPDAGTVEDRLRIMLDACVDRLRLGLAALLVPSRRIRVVRESPTRNLPDGTRLLSRLEKHLLAKMALHNATFHVGDEDLPEFQLPVPTDYRVLACPVRDQGARVIGCVLVMRAPGQNDFCASSSRLAEMVARRVAWVLSANFDPLTGLINRDGFEAELLQAAARRDGTASVLFIELDQLRRVNDSFGDAAGDEVLVQLSTLLRERLPAGAVLARLTGGRFALLCPAHDTGQARDFAEQICKAANWLQYMRDDRSVRISVSIGVEPLDADNARHVLTTAKSASKTARTRGGNRVEVFDDGDSSLIRRQSDLAIVTTLHKALENRAIRLLAQAVEPAGVGDGDAGGFYEVLLRLEDGRGEHILPRRFLPAAERYRLVPAIDRLVFERLFELLDGKAGKLVGCGHRLAVNISGQSLSDTGFLNFLLQALEAHEWPRGLLCLEIDEAAAVSNVARARSFMERLHAAGCLFALDNFGSGVSSFNYLKSLPADFLKIDGGFIANIESDPFADAMTAAILRVAGVLGARTVAAHVESPGIRSRVRALGVDFVQGSHIGQLRPLRQVLAQLAGDPAELAS